MNHSEMMQKLHELEPQMKCECAREWIRKAIEAEEEAVKNDGSGVDWDNISVDVFECFPCDSQ